MIPAWRARDTPMMSTNENRLNSSPPAGHQNVPSVSTPSTSRARPRIGGSSTSLPHSAELVQDGDFAGIDAFDAIAHRRFDQANVANQPRDAVGLERGCVIGAPHRTIERDVPLDAASPEGRGRHR